MVFDASQNQPSYSNCNIAQISIQIRSTLRLLLPGGIIGLRDVQVL